MLLAGYRRDECDLTDGGLPAAVVRPRSTADVSATLRLAAGRPAVHAVVSHYDARVVAVFDQE